MANKFFDKIKLKSKPLYPFAKWLADKFFPTILFHGILLVYMVSNLTSVWYLSLPAYGILYYYIKTELIYWIGDLRKAWLGMDIEPRGERNENP